MSKQQQLDALAEFAGLEKRTWDLEKHPNYFEWYKDDEPYCVWDDWNPYSNPAHTWLVLKALVKKVSLAIRIDTTKTTITLMWPDQLSLTLLPHKAFASAICEAAEEVMKGEKS